MEPNLGFIPILESTSVPNYIDSATAMNYDLDQNQTGNNEKHRKRIA